MESRSVKDIKGNFLRLARLALSPRPWVWISTWEVRAQPIQLFILPLGPLDKWLPHKTFGNPDVTPALRSGKWVVTRLRLKGKCIKRSCRVLLQMYFLLLNVRILLRIIFYTLLLMLNTLVSVTLLRMQNKYWNMNTKSYIARHKLKCHESYLVCKNTDVLMWYWACGNGCVLSKTKKKKKKLLVCFWLY